jgi:hypothetical protein
VPINPTYLLLGLQQLLLLLLLPACWQSTPAL